MVGPTTVRLSNLLCMGRLGSIKKSSITSLLSLSDNSVPLIVTVATSSSLTTAPLVSTTTATSSATGLQLTSKSVANTVSSTSDCPSAYAVSVTIVTKEKEALPLKCSRGSMVIKLGLSCSNRFNGILNPVAPSWPLNEPYEKCSNEGSVKDSS